MRTTLTLDEDVVAMLRRAMSENGTSLKEQINSALRFGLSVRPQPKERRQVTRSYDGGSRLISLTSISEALALAESV